MESMDASYDSSETYFNMLPLEILGELLYLLDIEDLEKMIIILGRERIRSSGVRMKKVKNITNEIQKLTKQNNSMSKSVEHLLIFTKIDVFHSENLDLMIPFKTYQPLSVSNENDNWQYHLQKYRILINCEKIFQLKVLRRRMLEILE